MSLKEKDSARGEFRREWLPGWETYALQHDIQLLGGADERRAVCPIHGGARDSLTINTKSGAWMCHSCGEHGGDVLAFHQARHGLGFVEAAQDLGAWDEPSEDDGQAPKRAPATETASKAAANPASAPKAAVCHESLSDFGRELWASCGPLAGDALAYLQARACVTPPRDGHLRWHPALKHPPSSTVGPALVALVTDAVTGQPLTLHRTWIRADGNKASLEPPRMLLAGHRKAGGVVRLWPDEAVTTGLGVAEGIETALSLAHAFTPAWACIDAGNLAALPVLGGIEALTVAADHDQAGIAAATACADRWAIAGREVHIVMPPKRKTDLNDMARAA